MPQCELLLTQHAPPGWQEGALGVLEDALLPTRGSDFPSAPIRDYYPVTGASSPIRFRIASNSIFGTATSAI